MYIYIYIYIYYYYHYHLRSSAASSVPSGSVLRESLTAAVSLFAFVV